MKQEQTTEYKAGYDCGLNGADVINSDFRLFATPEQTKEWEQGKRDAELDNKKPIHGAESGCPIDMCKRCDEIDKE